MPDALNPNATGRAWPRLSDFDRRPADQRFLRETARQLLASRGYPLIRPNYFQMVGLLTERPFDDLPKTMDEVLPGVRHTLKTELGLTRPGQRVSLPALGAFYHRLMAVSITCEEMGRKTGATIHPGLGIACGQYLLDEAARLGLSSLEIDRLTRRLAAGDVHAAGDGWGDQFALLSTPNSPPDIHGRVLAKAVSNYDRWTMDNARPDDDALSADAALPAVPADNIRKRLLQVFAVTGQMPAVVWELRDDLRRLCLKMAFPKRLGTSPQGVEQWQLTLNKAVYDSVKRCFVDMPAISNTFHVKPIDRYRTPPGTITPGFVAWAGQIQRLIDDPVFQAVFGELSAAWRAQGLGTEGFCEPVKQGLYLLFTLMGDRLSLRRDYTLKIVDVHPESPTYRGSYGKQVVTLCEKACLRGDGNTPAERRRVLNRLVATMFHELTHAKQDELAEAYRDDPRTFRPADRSRVADYATQGFNHFSHNTKTATALYGTRDYYDQSPWESDAFQISRWVEFLLDRPEK